MGSLRPSIFNQTYREDGGPFLIIESAEPEEEGVDVYFTNISTDLRQPGFPKERLLNVCPDRLTIWPLNVKRDSDDYLSPKYGSLERIIVTRRVVAPYESPTTTEDVETLLEELPDGFDKNFRFGLGLLWEYRFICEEIASLEDVNTLWLHRGDDSRIESPLFMLGDKRFHTLRRELNRISRHHRQDARKEKLLSTYQLLLHSADASRFPEKRIKLRSDALKEMVGGSRGRAILSKHDQQVAVRLVRENVEALIGSESNMLLALKSDIEIVTLKQLIERYREMLIKNLSEDKWQSFFKENPFVLSLAFTVPFMQVQGQAYVGGKLFNGRGGKYTDFLWASMSTGNLAIIEIKKPKTELFCRTPYRGNDVYSPSPDLGGAIAQVLNQRLNLQRNLASIKEAANRNDIHAFSLRCIIIAGTTPEEHAQKQSFELVRNALADITIVTFNELAIRLEEIYKVLAPPILKNDDLS